MLQRSANIVRLAADNLGRRRGIHLMLAFSIAIGTAIIVCLVLGAGGLRATAQANLMRLPLTKLWVWPGHSAAAAAADAGDIVVTEDLLKELGADPAVTGVWPQVDFERTAWVELVISVAFYREEFQSVVEVYGVNADLIKGELFAGCSFDWDGTGPVPVLFPAAVVNMINTNVSRQVLKEGKRFPADIIRNFRVNLHLATGRGGDDFAVVECRPVGVSTVTPQIGVVLPIAAVRQFNRDHAGRTGAAVFSRVLVETADADRAAGLATALEKRGYTIESSRATYDSIRRIFTGVQTAVAVLGLLIVAAVGIGLLNGLSLVTYAERDIIGVMRAVGARRRDIVTIILTQAGLTGLAGGLAGTALAFGAALGLEGPLAAAARAYGMTVPTLFAFDPATAAAGILLPPAACVLFGLAPALRAVATPPADMLH
ncbi:MAG: ABC transporter permease [Planctomycetota bacterium]